MRAILAALTVSTLAAAPTWAAEYGEAGTYELGGSLTFGRMWTEDLTTTFASVSPTVGLFVIDRLLVNVGAAATWQEIDYATTNNGTAAVALGAGAAYLIPAGTLFAGPEVFGMVAGGRTDSSSAISWNYGYEAVVRGVIKMPIGDAGLITIGGGYRFSKTYYDVEPEREPDAMHLLTVSAGISVFF